MSRSDILTLEQLDEFDGVKNEKIYVAISGEIYDVSSAEAMYGKNGRYNVLAGKDATYALASMDLSDSSFDSIRMNENLSAKQLESLDTWIGKFKSKYQVVGKIKSSLPNSKVENEKTEKSAKVCPFSENNNEATNDSNSLRCPLGFDRKKSKGVENLPKMTLEILKMHSSSNKKMPNLISVKGRIYDISNHENLFASIPLYSLVGREASRVLAEGIFKEENLDQSLDGISIEAHIRLEKYFQQLEDSLDPVATLAEEDYNKVFGSVEFDNSNDSCEDIHKHIEAKNVEGVKNILNKNPDSVNSLCPRSGLSALHKAVEVDSVEIAEILLKNGAKIDTKCLLYDDDTPYQLAKRFDRTELIKILE
eukprot:CAMPEP_0171458186 /NCGR_PEP_ID=MMETSP0945-20130129/3966_1 /TAXON_ID=109269 /ORGANISM="Vaucheria litorea, Strain CCMP2940" /LENGTH=364 /DNA_ID=CAMNT_0011983945 /DNA_START=79 /DNA_END=1173 /DNA_ORIENTATION=-